jgi:hypothetical protein
MTAWFAITITVPTIVFLVAALVRLRREDVARGRGCASPGN